MLQSLITKAHNITKNVFNAEERALQEIADIQLQIDSKKAKKLSDKLHNEEVAILNKKRKEAEELDILNKKLLADKKRKEAEELALQHRDAIAKSVTTATNRLKATGYVIINTLQNTFNSLQDVELDEEIITNYENEKQSTLDKLEELHEDVVSLVDEETEHLTQQAYDIYNDYKAKVLQLDVVQYALRNNKTTRYFSDEQRTEIYLRDKGVCQLCNTPVTLKKFDCDHIIPWSKGGQTTISNGQCTCQTCNRSKGNN